MYRLKLTLPTPAENVALDEALLDWAEAAGPEEEVLRLWESPQPMVVVGRSSHVNQEVNEAACRERGVPILRRSSGGAAIVAGSGCLMYAVVLSHKLRPDLKDIRRAHAFVLGRIAESLRPALARVGNVDQAGISDLVLASEPGTAVSLKFSGNSMRAKRSHLLYHGTVLYDFDLRLIESFLKMPPRQPAYRDLRPHRNFVTNLPLTRQSVLDALDRAWPTHEELIEWPCERVADLVGKQFGHDSWNFEFR